MLGTTQRAESYCFAPDCLLEEKEKKKKTEKGKEKEKCFNPIDSKQFATLLRWHSK